MSYFPHDHLKSTYANLTKHHAHIQASYLFIYVVNYWVLMHLIYQLSFRFFPLRLVYWARHQPSRPISIGLVKLQILLLLSVGEMFWQVHYAASLTYIYIYSLLIFSLLKRDRLHYDNNEHLSTGYQFQIPAIYSLIVLIFFSLLSVGATTTLIQNLNYCISGYSSVSSLSIRLYNQIIQIC